MVPPRRPLSFERRTVASADGTAIAYYVTAAPFAAAPVVVLASGLGGSAPAWQSVIDYLSYGYRFITWDYRGLYASSRPWPDLAASYAVPKHVEDLRAILQKEGVARAAIVGWSMGVQIALEAFRQLDITANLVLMNGGYGRPLQSLTPISALRPMLPALVNVARRVHGLGARAAHRATLGPETIARLGRVGFLGATPDAKVLAELMRELGTLDLEGFYRNLGALELHDAADVLETVDVPTLIVAGDRDRLTPRALTQQMMRRIHGAELLMVRGGTHYTCIEFPELINLRIERFFQQHGF